MNSKIYLFNHALKGIGRGGYPQSQKMSEGYDYSASDSIHKLHPEKFPDFEPNFNSVVLMDGAQPTDLISTAPFPYYVLLVSDKLLQILTAYKLPPYKIYNTSMIHKGSKLEGYYALYILDPKEYLNYIDFDKSIFNRQFISGHKNIEILKLNSIEDLNRESEKDKVHNTTTLEPATGVWAEELVMKDEFYDKVDLFSLSSITFPVHFKVTEKLKTAIEKENCTGVVFQSVSDKEALRDSFWKKIVATYFPQI